MTTEELAILRNLMRTNEAKLLVEYLGNFLTEEAQKQSNTDAEIRGMAKMLHEVKSLSNTLQAVIENRKKG